MRNGKVVVCGGGGFIGGHLVGDLLDKGYKHVRCVDIKPKSEWYQVHAEAENVVADLNLQRRSVRRRQGHATSSINLACNMGGMGFIENNKGLCMISVLINTHLLMAAREHGVKRFFYASIRLRLQRRQAEGQERSTCSSRKRTPIPRCPKTATAGRSSSASACAGTSARTGKVPTRVARFHNVYGPFGTWDGGREKAPAAICRKVIEAKLTGKHEIEIWGDGQQTRSFMYIADCLKGIYMITDSETCIDPINLGSRRRRDDQPAGRHRRGHRRHQAEAQVQPRRPQGRQRPQQRQHADQEGLRLGAGHQAARRHGEDLRVDLRPDVREAEAEERIPQAGPQ